MAWQWTPYTIPLLLAVVVPAGLIIVAYRSRETRGTTPLIAFLCGTIFWSLGDVIRVSTTVPVVKIIANNIRFLGPFVVTPSVFLFAAAYTNREHWLRPRRVVALCLFHGVSFLLLWTNPWHHLMRKDTTIDQASTFVVMEIEWGTWFYLHTIYSYLLVFAAVLILAIQLKNSLDVSTYRGQIVTILVGLLVPWGFSIAYVTGLTEFDLTALGFTITGGMFAIAMFRYQMLDLVPIARSTAVDIINEGYLVVDAQNTIVDVNREATAIIGVGRGRLIGRSFENVYAEYPEVIERFGSAQDMRDQISLEVAGETRYFDVDVSPIYDRREQYTGRVILFRDITEQNRRKQRLERQKAELERQNERLEEFASIVSHDLRNPMSVVSGRMELARQQPEDEHFDEMEAGLERMEAIIDDVLAMARQGQTVDETELIDLATVTEDAWQNLDTQKATLSTQTMLVFEANRSRLLQVFENLFRNAIEHCSPNVTVTVGDLDDGFYVADDGPGIPPDKQTKVLEKGYTTAEDGTGFGLAIVQTAVEAHGWTLTITERNTGGTRFEIHDVDINTTSSADKREVTTKTD